MAVPPPDIAGELLSELGWVHRLARRLVGEGADDLTQEVATLALQSEPRSGGLRAWLAAVTRRRAARWHRNRKRRMEAESEHPGQPPGDDPAAVVTRLEQQRQLVQAVLDLAEPYRSVIVARFFDELSPAEIGKRRRTSADAVRQQVHRGLGMLRARLQRELGPDWKGALALLALPGVAHAAVLTGGVIVMKKLLVAAAGVAAVLVAWWSFAGSPETPVREGLFAAPQLTSQNAEVGVPAPTPIPDRRPLGGVAEPSFVLEVVTDDGHPVPDARVLLHSGHSVQSAVTDPSGAASFDPDLSPGGVLVVPGNRPPVFEALDTVSGLKRLVLPNGASVAGRVHVFDRPLPGPVELRLYSKGGSFFETEVPQEILTALGEIRPRVRLDHLSLRTDSAGLFEFRGLQDTWSGTLRMKRQEPYWMRPESSLQVTGPRVATVPGPTEGAVLSLSRLRSVRGRVLWRDGSPALDAAVMVMMTHDYGRNSPGTGVPLDADGRFEVGLDISSPRHFEAWRDDPGRHMEVLRVGVDWSHPDAVTTQRVEVPAADLGSSHDLGDLILDRALNLHVLVQDPSGAPVAGAHLEGRGMPSPTDANGLGVVGVEDLAQRTFRIGAPGWSVRHYTAEGGSGTQLDPLRFTVQPGNRLTVVVQSAELDLSELGLEVHADQPIFTASGPRGWMTPRMHVAAGASKSPGATFRDGSGETQFDLDDGGTVELCSVKPGLPVRLRVVDQVGQVVGERRVHLPAVSTHEELEIRTEDRVSTIVGTVMLEGVPVSRASVSIRGEKRGLSRQTDDEGEFTIRLLATGKPISVEIDHTDAPALNTEVVLEPGMLRPRFLLDRAHELEVRVLDEAGALVEAVVGFEDSRVQADRSNLSSGHVKLSRMNAGPQVLQVRVAGRTFESNVDASRDSVVEVRVPAPTTVRLHIPAGLPAERFTIQLEDVERPDVSIRERINLVDGRWLPGELLVFPGTYRVSCWPDGSEQSQAWTAEWTIEAGGPVDKTVLR